MGILHTRLRVGSLERSFYDLGNGFGRVAIEVPDAYAACAEIERRGGTVVREAVP